MQYSSYWSRGAGLAIPYAWIHLMSTYISPLSETATCIWRVQCYQGSWIGTCTVGKSLFPISWNIMKNMFWVDYGPLFSPVFIVLCICIYSLPQFDVCGRSLTGRVGFFLVVQYGQERSDEYRVSSWPIQETYWWVLVAYMGLSFVSSTSVHLDHFVMYYYIPFTKHCECMSDFENVFICLQKVKEDSGYLKLKWWLYISLIHLYIEIRWQFICQVVLWEENASRKCGKSPL